MTIFLIVLHVLVCVFLILFVLLQPGARGGVGAAFGGAGGQTVFGGRGANTFLAKLTAASAVIFMLTSISLSYFVSKSSSVMKDRVPATAPATDDDKKDDAKADDAKADDAKADDKADAPSGAATTPPAGAAPPAPAGDATPPPAAPTGEATPPAPAGDRLPRPPRPRRPRPDSEWTRTVAINAIGGRWQGARRSTRRAYALVCDAAATDEQRSQRAPSALIRS